MGFLLGSNDLGDQKASYFPLYWVFIRDPYNGLLVYNNPYTIGWYNPLYNPTNQGLFHRSSVQSSDWGEVGSFIFALSTLFHAKCLKYVSKGAKTKTVEQTAGTATNFPWFGPPLSTLPSPQGTHPASMLCVAHATALGSASIATAVASPRRLAVGK